MNKTKQTKIVIVASGLLFGLLALMGLTRVGVRPAAAAGGLAQTCPTVGGQTLLYDWDGNVTTAARGFPGFDTDGIGDKTIPASCNPIWSETPNITFHFRVKIYDQPVPQDDIKMQFCFWQKNSNENFRRENCTKLNRVPVGGANFVQWSVGANAMWKKDRRPILWNKPRTWQRSVFKNGQNKAVSNWMQPIWGGENPNDWYPLDMCFQVLAVPGSEAPQWGNFPCDSRP